MAEKNTNDNQNSKKKHKWIGIFLIALLLLFIGLAGYYLERDLEPVPDNQIEDSQVLDEGADSTESSEETSINGEQSESTNIEEEQETEELTESDEKAPTSDMGAEEEITESDEEAVSTDMEAESEDSSAEDKDRRDLSDSSDSTAVTEEPSAADDDSGSSVTDQQSDKTAEPEKTAENEINGEDSEKVREESLVEEEETEAEQQSQQVDSETESEDKSDLSQNLAQESDLEQESEDTAGEDSSQLEPETDTEGQVESEKAEDFSQEIEEPSLLDRILSILGLSDSDFSQDLNILFVGLDDEESVAVGTIEADSIMFAKLRPESNKLQLEHIDEDTIYKGQLLREYYNGDIQPAVEEITENEIDYYVYVNYQGFEKVIDELGGVQITLNQEVKVPGLGLNLKAGDNLLSGKEALNFVRWRDSDSLARFERQKLLINSVMAKLRSNNILFNVKELYNTIVESYSSIETDINPVLAAEIFSYLRENKELELEYIE